MWPFSYTKSPARILLTNTLTGAKEVFKKHGSGPVTMYSCGPTVYGPQHIGNLRAAVFSDTLARTLTASGYRVKRVINITDVGHLVGDGDEGEDKMSVGAARENSTPEEIANRYTERYLHDIRALNIDTNSIQFPRATAYITEQVCMIQALEKKKLTYKTSDGIYFDTEKFKAYGVLGNVRAIELQAGTRVALGEKKNEHDFVLWRKAKPNDLQQWDSPWGRGNPGWSIECSAMATNILGNTIDIHTGGQDHIQVHHNNEIAQSEGATGKSPFAWYWLHNAFLTIGGEKISKSLGNTYTLEDITARNIHPLALRYFFLQAHYRTPLSFSWEALAASEEALTRLWKLARSVKQEAREKEEPFENTKRVKALLEDDLGTAQAIALLWDTLGNSSVRASKKYNLLKAADRVLGLSLTTPPEEAPSLSLSDLPDDIHLIAKERETARKNKDFSRSDELRIHLEERGYRVEDAPSGTIYTKERR